MTKLVFGVTGANVALLLTGYAILSGSLRGRPVRHWVSYAGVALLVGAATVPTLLFFAVIAGAHASLATAFVAAAAISVAGVTIGRYAPQPKPSPPEQRVGTFSAVLGGAVAAVCALGILGGFRSSPWLDDAWGIWLPKGLALWHVGLDERLFVPGGRYVAFGVPDYPLWWSILASLDVQAVGSVDVRAINAQLAVLVVAFVGAVARLLWGIVRPTVLVVAVALLVFSVEFWRQAQGGVPDLALAIYVALLTLGIALWVGRGDAFALLIATIAGVATVQVKTEGVAYVLLIGAVAAIAARPRHRLGGLGLSTAICVASAVPWLAWRVAHDVPSRVPLSFALSPSRLLDAANRLAPTIGELLARLFDPTSWLVVVPLLVVAGGVGFVRDRRIEWLLPSLGLLLGLGFLVWAYWSNPDDLDYLLSTSAYRTVDPLILSAGVLLALEVELLLRQ